MSEKMNSESAQLSATSSDDESYLDGCIICLEPFTSADPPSVTKCKHEYHLHCILDWSHRRTECPVCLRHLVLTDSSSQELLSSAVRENQSSEVDDNEQPIMRHVSSGRRTETIPAYSSSIPTHASNMNLINLDSFSLDTDSSPSPNPNPGKSSSSEFASFSESLKSKISTASMRYKESVSKSTLSFKGKLIARNDSVKELSRGIQREVSAGIAGIARMIAKKRGRVSSASTNDFTVIMREDDSAVVSPWLVRGESSKEATLEP